MPIFEERYPRRVERLTLGRMQHPVRGFLHGGAALAALAGLIVLVTRTASDIPRMLSMVVFGSSMVALFTTSSLYHSVPWKKRWKQRMQRFDHSMIFLLVAGTYTPIAFNVLDGPIRSITLLFVWGAALVGILQKMLLPKIRNWFSITLYMVMGWFAVIPLPRLVARLNLEAVLLLIAGGVLYSVGMVLLVTKRPRLAPRVFSYHEVFHILVIAGSTMHFLLILWFVSTIPRLA